MYPAVWYMIRGVRLVQTPSGSYYDESTGVVVAVNIWHGNAEDSLNLFHGASGFHIAPASVV